MILAYWLHHFGKCEENIWSTVKFLDNLGLQIHPTMSVLVQTQQFIFVGFVICSRTMTVRLTSEKIENIKHLCTELYHKKFTTIRKCSQLVGMLVASEPGVLFAPFHYRPLEKLNSKT